MRLRRPLQSLLGLLVVTAAGVLVANAVTTTSARVTASTSASGLFTAGEIALDQPGVPTRLLFNAAGLYPGATTSGCVVLDYTGTVAAEIRIHAATTGGTGLEHHVELTLTRLLTTPASTSIGSGLPAGPGDGENPCEPAPTQTQIVFDDRLAALSQRHGSWTDGLPVAVVEPGDRVVLLGTATLVDGNAAQGLDTEFTLLVEARP